MAANEAARDRLDAGPKAAKQRRAELIAEWGLPEKPPTRIGRPSYQQIWDMGLWQMLDEVCVCVCARARAHVCGCVGVCRGAIAPPPPPKNFSHPANLELI